ncbi:MAG TPA: hypothetical protein VEL73_08360, partial [Mycobacteriales bacterium]|nr:hypothetical protein [Mycobacteriales bacterium]
GALDSASAAYRRLLARVEPLRPLPELSTLAEARGLLSGAALDALDRVDAALSDDLATPRVLAELQGVLRDETLSEKERAIVVAAADVVLGLRLGDLDPAEVVHHATVSVPVERVEQLVAERGRARRERRWADADRLRDELLELGVQVTDTPGGSRWAPVEVPTGN